MIDSIHHINFIVSDLQTGLERFEAIVGRPVDRQDDLPERGVRTASFLLGESWLVLVQPTDPDSVPGRFLAENGEGFFLLSLGVADLEVEQTRIRSAGIGFSGPARRGIDSWRIWDLDPAATLGEQFQLTEEQ